MSDVIQHKLNDWVQGKNLRDARITIYYMIRDIPYGVIPALHSPERYLDMLKLNRGSCVPKHFLLCNMYQRIRLEMLYVVYPFTWGQFEMVFPLKLRRLAKDMPLSCHLACKVNIDGEPILVDATLDPALGKVGLPVNREWDGISETLLAVSPCGDEELYHPSEADLMPPPLIDKKSLAFYEELNLWLEQLRG